MSDAAQWGRARDALRLFALDPKAMGGLWIRARPGPARDHALRILEPLGARRLSPSMSDEALDGGLDLAATLATGRPVRRSGLIDAADIVCLTMAERAAPALAARLGQAMDAGELGVIALDESAGDDEHLPAALGERLGLFLNLDDLPRGALGAVPLPDRTRARSLYCRVTLPDGAFRNIVAAAVALGIDSLRAPMLTGRAARGLAALDGRLHVEESDLIRAVELTLAHRGVMTDAPSDETAPPPPPPDDRSDERPDTPPEASEGPPPELLVEAARASLPPDLLSALVAGRVARTQRAAQGSGAAIRSNRRGRPLPARPGQISDAARLDVAATLRAAAPWQKLRRESGPARLLHLRSEDFRIRRFEQKSDRLLIFAVDASGSQAMARLAEAKGAIELLLSQAYARRDHVALIAFRGAGAELLLPPTRSLVQTRKRLAALPGGGGTPLATGLLAAVDLARHAGGRGFTPSLALLTDGRANIDLEGHADRMQAGDDARRIAAEVQAICPGGLVVDTGRRATPDLAALAGIMSARYLALPRADASRLGQAVAPIMAS